MKTIEFNTGLGTYWRDVLERKKRERDLLILKTLAKNLADFKKIVAAQKREKEKKRKAEEKKQQDIAIAQTNAIIAEQDRQIETQIATQTTTPQTTIIKAGKETTPPPKKNKGFLGSENTPLILGGVAVAVLGVFLVTGGKKKNNSKKVKV